MKWVFLSILFFLSSVSSAQDHVEVSLSQANLSADRKKMEPLPLSPNKNALLAGIGFGVSGLTLGTIGLIEMSNAKNGQDYQTYKRNQNPTDPIWAELDYTSSEDPRKELYDKQNQKYVKGQALLYAGAGVLVAGAIVVNKLIKKNRAIAPDIGFHPVIHSTFLPYPLFTLSAGIQFQF